ncbi:MAG TPA: hypothetical protein VKS79_03355 [Gemmataceae bacterium]|nr:hypothetical protein [Gemmataceae bacterium]
MKTAAHKFLTAAAFLMVLITAFIDLWLALFTGVVLLLAFGIWERLELRRLAHR